MAELEHERVADASDFSRYGRTRGGQLRHLGLFALVLWLLGSAASVQAEESGQRVHRCIGRNGEVVFSGTWCSAEPASAGALAKAQSEAAAQGAPAADTCATSVAQLRERIAGAIARQDSNTIAGAMRWRGVSGGEAKQVLAQLRDLVREPLLAIEGGSTSIEVKTGSNLDAGVRSMRFGISDESGCYWLSW
ncbi:hypothetical protein [Dokdonella sp.]|uniref:hypothetical protein n=1 Tax=Dokdonella sp. TaxID=2291710 RepID=UPI0025BD835E|nr:hypothetical protein [Dokdonella sp.]MBX3689826.1 hypothetical protein [Dokdonella sp.]